MTIEKTDSLEKILSSEKMNSEKTFDHFLARHLQTEHDYIDDDGFTARVMTSLPASKRIHPFLEKLILGLPVFLIAALVLSQFPWREMVQPAYAMLLTVNTESFIKMGVVLLAMISTMTALWGAKRLDII